MYKVIFVLLGLAAVGYSASTASAAVSSSSSTTQYQQQTQQQKTQQYAAATTASAAASTTQYQQQQNQQYVASTTQYQQQQPQQQQTQQYVAATAASAAASTTQYQQPQQQQPQQQQTQPQQKPKYVRPCHPISDKCVRDNLAANSKCNKNVRGWLPEEYRIESLWFDAAYFNASYEDTNLVFKDQKCRFSEFFYNVEADSLVLSVDCSLTTSSNRTLHQHYTYKEDSVYSFTSTWQYPLLRFTTNIRKANAIDMCRAYIFTDVAVMPTFVLTPNDTPSKNFLSRDLSYLNIYERAMWYTKGPYVFHNFMRNVGCDFGC